MSHFEVYSLQSRGFILFKESLKNIKRTKLIFDSINFRNEKFLMIFLVAGKIY